jgi:cytochrome oxidase Cu insertion factor (SCO1/SenC/PrrC family)
VTSTRAPERSTSGPTSPARRLLLAAVMCLVLGGLAGLFAATFTGAAPLPTRFTPARVVAFDFHLHDQDGRPASLADARGKVALLTFVYTDCRDVCPAAGATIAGALKQVGTDKAVAYALSVDPVGDNPARARDWLLRRGFTPRDGRYILGTRAQMRRVWLHYGIAPIGATPAEAKAAAIAGDKFRAAYPPTRPAPVQYKFPPPRKAPEAAQQAYPNTTDLQYRGPARHIAGSAWEHSAYVLLIDKHGVQRVGIPFEQVTADGLVRDIRTLAAQR